MPAFRVLELIERSGLVGLQVARKLRAVVAASRTLTLDEEGRGMAKALQESLEQRSAALLMRASGEYSLRRVTADTTRLAGGGEGGSGARAISTLGMPSRGGRKPRGVGPRVKVSRTMESPPSSASSSRIASDSAASL